MLRLAREDGESVSPRCGPEVMPADLMEFESSMFVNEVFDFLSMVRRRKC